jgi:hypothetical protein
MLSIVTNTNVDIVKSAIKIFTELGLMEICDDKTIYMTETQKMLGESSSTKRVQQFRERKKQLMLINTNDDKCAYCGEEGIEPDHIIPKTKGGTDDSNNIVLSCRRCNGTKHNKDVSDFLNDNIQKFIDLDRVLRNSNILKYVDYVGGKFKMKRYRNVTETVCETEIEIEKELEKDIEKEKDIALSNDNVSVEPDEPLAKNGKIDFKAIAEWWNAHSKLKEITAVTDKRKSHLTARIKEHGIDAIYKAIDNVSNSKFLHGDNGKGWIATFDWVFLPNNFIKVLEGNYNNTDKSYINKTAERAERLRRTIEGIKNDA